MHHIFEGKSIITVYITATLHSSSITQKQLVSKKNMVKILSKDYLINLVLIKKHQKLNIWWLRNLLFMEQNWLIGFMITADSTCILRTDERKDLSNHNCYRRWAVQLREHLWRSDVRERIGRHDLCDTTIWITEFLFIFYFFLTRADFRGDIYVCGNRHPFTWRQQPKHNCKF